MLFKIAKTCILGVKGQIVDLPDCDQTNERLKKGIIVISEQSQPTEKKRRIGSRK